MLADLEPVPGNQVGWRADLNPGTIECKKEQMNIRWKHVYLLT